MDVDSGYKSIKKFRGRVQWCMMESKDNISSINFKLKIENSQLVSFDGQNIIFVYLSKKFNSYKCLEHFKK